MFSFDFLILALVFWCSMVQVGACPVIKRLKNGVVRIVTCGIYVLGSAYSSRNLEYSFDNTGFLVTFVFGGEFV